MSRHIYNFFAKAWLFDIFIAKVSRLLFFISRTFIQRYIESGLFEFINVLFAINSLSSLQSYVSNHTTTGNLSVYIYNIVIGGLFFVISTLFIVVVFLV